MISNALFEEKMKSLIPILEKDYNLWSNNYIRNIIIIVL